MYLKGTIVSLCWMNSSISLRLFGLKMPCFTIYHRKSSFWNSGFAKKRINTFNDFMRFIYYLVVYLFKFLVLMQSPLMWENLLRFIWMRKWESYGVIIFLINDSHAKFLFKWWIRELIFLWFNSLDLWSLCSFTSFTLV